MSIHNAITVPEIIRRKELTPQEGVLYYEASEVPAELLVSKRPVRCSWNSFVFRGGCRVSVHRHESSPREIMKSAQESGLKLVYVQ